MRKLVRGRGQQQLAAFLMGLILALLMGAGITRADGPEERPQTPLRANWVGFDISWPQCHERAFPPGQVAFGIVGVTGGKPYTVNPCLRDQYRWAKTGAYPAEVYINLDYWKRLTFRHFFGPAGLCSFDDVLCQSYNYGWNAAKEAVAFGRENGVDAKRWWLDVETMNHWSKDTSANARIVRAAIDYLESQGLETGIYSTPYQWGVIAGDFAPGVPVWTAGATSLAGAMQRCTDPRYAFAGGRVELVQYVEEFDTNYACP
ncbi:MAG: hypothetical protein ACM3S1_02430 [Hyphomicrobiales bacterium]